MSRELIIRPEAEADLTEAFEWYETRVLGLGLEFIRTVDSLFNSIIRNPKRIQSSIRPSVGHSRESSPTRSSSWLMPTALSFSPYSMPNVVPSAGKKESKGPRTNRSSGRPIATRR